MQKLLYLYGFHEISNVEDEIDDETKIELLYFMGIMLSGNTGASSLSKIAKDALGKQIKNVLKQPLTKTTTWYPVLKKWQRSWGKI